MFLWPMRLKSYLWVFLSLAATGGGVPSLKGTEVEPVAGVTAVQDELWLDALSCSAPRKNVVQIATHAHNRATVMIIATRLVVHNWTNGHPHRWFRFPGVQTATVSSGLLSSGQLSTGVHPFH